MIRTVGALGGISKLLKLYDGCRERLSKLDQLGLLPKREVKRFEVEYEYQDSNSVEELTAPTTKSLS
jgi:hypothetical protein